MSMSKSLLILAGIFCLGLCLRLFNLANLPRQLNRDEAALAYNALLLKETGQDEWGRRWPLALESFGDYKLPGYPLLLVGVFSLFGYSDVATRLPSALAGSLLIVLAYWWGRRLKWSVSFSLVTALLIAVTPIFWFYSRMAFEANVGLVLLVASLGLLWWGVKGRPSRLSDLLAIGLYLLAVFTYNTPLLLLPFIMASLPAVRGVRDFKAWLWPMVGLLIVGMLAGSVLLPLSAQKSGITIFSDETIWQQSIDYRAQFSGLTQKIIGSKYVYFGLIAVKNFWLSFSPSFLVTRGGAHPWHQLPNWGHLYWIVYGTGLVGIGVMLAGVLTFLRNVFKKKALQVSNDLLLLYLLIISLAPSVITVDSPHATRSLLFFFIFSLVAVRGVQFLQTRFPVRLQNLVLGSFVLLLLISAGQYSVAYFYEYPQQQGVFQPGLESTLQSIEQKYPGQPVAVVDGSGYLYILITWYLKMTPQTYFASVIKQLPNQIGFKYGQQVGRYHFIAEPADRSPEEKIMMEWESIGQAWSVTTF